MLRKFKIKVDGTEYLVEMEELTVPDLAPAPSAPTAGADAQTAPMPGKILEIKHNVGDAVSANDTVLVLEAMKMENAIVAERAGTITAMHVSAGQMVNPGDALFTIG